MHLLQTINELILKLPGKDSSIALKYLKNRDFKSIHEIVKSDIYLTEQNALKGNPSEKYANVDLEELIELREALEDYMSKILFPDELINIEESFYD